MLKLYRASCQSVSQSPSVRVVVILSGSSNHLDSRGSWERLGGRRWPSGFGRRSVGLAHPELLFTSRGPLRVERFFDEPFFDAVLLLRRRRPPLSSS